MNRTLRGFQVLLGVALFIFSLPEGAQAASPPQILNFKIEADQFLKQGQIEQAISRYKAVLKKDGRFANAHYNLATAYYLKGDMKRAAESLEAFLRLAPEDSEALYNLGCLKIRLGHFDEAMKCFLKAENCPCSRSISRKIKEALRFTKGLRTENPGTQKLLAFLLTLSPSSGNG